MASTLDDLFDQIIHSERRAQERKSLLNEVKSQILQTEENISDLQEEHDALKGELVIKKMTNLHTSSIQQLNEEELSCKWVKNKEIILSEQWSKLKQTKEELILELKTMQEKLELEMDNFCKQVNNVFTEVYDLCGHGQIIREQEANRLKESLTKEEEALSEAITTIESCQKSVKQLKVEYERYTKIRNDLIHQYKDKEIELETEKKKTEELDREKERIMTVPQQDPEFVRLHTELEESKPEPLEEKCIELQKEVQTLQQKLWQKQIKQRQQAFQHQQSSLWQQQKQQQRNDVDIEQPKSNRVCVTNYSSSTSKTSAQKGNTSQGQVLTESHSHQEDLSQEDLNEIFNDDMTTEKNTQKKLFKPRSKSTGAASFQ